MCGWTCSFRAAISRQIDESENAFSRPVKICQLKRLGRGLQGGARSWGGGEGGAGDGGGWEEKWEKDLKKEEKGGGNERLLLLNICIEGERQVVLVEMVTTTNWQERCAK